MDNGRSASSPAGVAGELGCELQLHDQSQECDANIVPPLRRSLGSSQQTPQLGPVSIKEVDLTMVERTLTIKVDEDIDKQFDRLVNETTTGWGTGIRTPTT